MPSRELFSPRQERSRYVAISVRLSLSGWSVVIPPLQVLRKHGDFLVAVPVKKKKKLAPQAPFRARKLSGKV